MPRLFIAIRLPDFIKEDLVRLRDERMRAASWLPPEQLHLTLKFIGDWPVDQISEIEEALETIKTDAFLLEAQGVGRFPGKGRPRVLWTGLGTAHPRLFQIKHRIENDLLRLGVEPDPRVYQPHITLARCTGATSEDVAPFLKQQRDYTSPPFRVTGFSLMESTLTSRGPLHEERTAFALET